MISSSQKPRRDTHLMKLCALSRQHIAEMLAHDMTVVACQKAEGSGALAATRNWYIAAEAISRTRALTFAGIRAKTQVCHDVVTKLGGACGDTETLLIRSLFRDILNN